MTDYISTDVKVHFTDGTNQIVKVMTSDLDESGTYPTLTLLEKIIFGVETRLWTSMSA